jgi:AcrR family transcriptional regulator
VTDTERDRTSSISRRRARARRDARAGYLERRQKVLSAAAEVFRAKGYQAASMNDIAGRSGSDRASIYYYFSSKREIFTELVRRAAMDNVANAEEIAAAEGPTVARLHRLIVGLVESYERHYPYLHLYVQEDMRRLAEDASGADAELHALGDRYQRAVFSIAEEGLRTGEFRTTVDPAMLTLAVLGAVNWCHRWFVPGGRLTATEIGASFADVLLNGAVTS